MSTQVFAFLRKGGEVITISCLFSTMLFGQSDRDSTLTTYRSYSSVGFNVSSVSGMGLSYRYHSDSPISIQFTGGFLISENSTSTSLGFEFQYDLSQRKTFRYYIAIGIGTYSGAASSTKAMGFGMGIELPIIGAGELFQSVVVGGDIFYPTLYSKRGSTNIVTVGGSLNLFYNF